MTQPSGFPAGASQAQLQRALLPSQELSSTATITTSGSSLSQIVGACGEPIPGGARYTAYESLQDSQTGQNLTETITEWNSAAAAINASNSSRNAIDQAGNCSISVNGITEEVTADNSGSPPPECTGGQYLATQVSISSTLYSGYQVGAQCGSYSVVIRLLGNSLPLVTQEDADGYLTTAAGMLQNVIG